MSETKEKINGWREGSGYVGSFIHLADQAYFSHLTHPRGTLSEEEKAELTGTLEHVRETTRWFGRGLSAIGSLMISSGNMNPEDLVGAGGLIHELGEAISHLQDIDERLTWTLTQNGAEPPSRQGD